MRTPEQLRAVEPDTGQVRIVARYGQPVLRHRDELREAVLRRDVASLKVTLDFVLDEIGRNSPDAQEAAIMLLKQRVAELEEHWRSVTLGNAAKDLEEAPGTEGDAARSELASVETLG